MLSLSFCMGCVAVLVHERLGENGTINRTRNCSASIKLISAHFTAERFPYLLVYLWKYAISIDSNMQQLRELSRGTIFPLLESRPCIGRYFREIAYFGAIFDAWATSDVRMLSNLHIVTDHDIRTHLHVLTHHSVSSDYNVRASIDEITDFAVGADHTPRTEIHIVPNRRSLVHTSIARAESALCVTGRQAPSKYQTD